MLLGFDYSPGCYQLAFRKPGTFPSRAMFLKQIRHSPNRR
jgi:hypothetical protein